MPYKQTGPVSGRRLIIADEDAYDHAKAELDGLSEKDKRDFVDWFYSAGWIYLEEEELDAG